MKDTAKHLALAEKSCLKQGSCLTLKRKQVLNILLHADKAISAYEVIDAYQSEYHETLAPMSAYRMLEFLEKVKLIHKLHIANKYVACSHIGCEHDDELTYFLFCHKCQRVDEIPSQSTSLPELVDSVAKAGYQLSSSQIELNCICNACAND